MNRDVNQLDIVSMMLHHDLDPCNKLLTMLGLICRIQLTVLSQTGQALAYLNAQFMVKQEIKLESPSKGGQFFCFLTMKWFVVPEINRFSKRITAKQIASFENNLLFNIQFVEISVKLSELF